MRSRSSGVRGPDCPTRRAGICFQSSNRRRLPSGGNSPLQLQRENEYLQQQIGKLNDIDGSDYDLPYGRYVPSYYPKSSGVEVSIDEITEPIKKYLGRLLKYLYSLLVYMVRGWVLLYQLILVSLNKLIQRARFTKQQVIILTVLGIFTLTIMVAIGLLVTKSFLNIP